MSNVINDAKAEYNRAKGRMSKALADTPDDKVNWSPSSTARTPVQVVAHAAIGTAGIHGMMKGDPFPYSGPQEMDTASRAMEKEYTTREQAIGILDKTSDDYLAWLDSLTEEQLAGTWDTPFGSFPMAMAITFPADHLRGHCAQIEYIQTVYGDLDWHLG